MVEYNITDYLKDDPELQKAVIEELLKEIKLLQEKNEYLEKEWNHSEKIICRLHDKLEGD